MVFGPPHRSVSGQWAGKVLRFSLEVAQSPEVGRKSSVKDRRPITNIPIVRLRVVEVRPPSGVEVELDAEHIDISDFVVAAELFSPVSSSTHPSGPSTSGPSSSGSNLPPPAAPPPERRSYFSVVTKGAHVYSADVARPDVDLGFANLSDTNQPPPFSSLIPSPSRPERNILGNLATSAVKLYDLEGKLAIWFFYHDIAIRSEGDYSLRFQFCDLGSQTEDLREDAPILADCYSEPFTVHAPRNHPGVPPTTPLMKHFASQGYRLTVKKTEGTLTAGEFEDGSDDDPSLSSVSAPPASTSGL